ncbi:MAG: hypothetical protein HQL18_01660 [Candidatus Omnitrophica bacterium]|nr:hypothetical protein [Candidatus Omnitrophota bacterium]
MKKEKVKIGFSDLALLFPRLVQKGYVNQDFLTSPRFCDLDVEFRSWFPQYTEEHFHQVEFILEHFYSAKAKPRKKMSDPQFKEFFEHDAKMADGLSRLIDFGVESRIRKNEDKNKYLHD